MDNHSPRSAFRTAGQAIALALILTTAQAAMAETKTPAIYYGIGSESSEYGNAQVFGAKAVAASVNAKFSVLASDYQGQKFLQDFGAIFAAGCKDCVAILDPASNAFTKALVDRAAQADAKILTFWNSPDGIHPWDTDSDNWVAHLSFDGVESGYKNGQALCKSIGGQGGVVALMGIADNPPAKQRFAGFKHALAECPGMKLLDSQYADWDQTKAQTITRGWLARYGASIKAIFAEDDGMALGAVAALREKGLAGKVQVSGSNGQSDALALVKSGEMTSTMYVDGAMQGAVSTALGYAVARGDLDLKKLTHAQREFYLQQTLVTKDNVDQILARKPNAADYTYEKIKANFWQTSAGPVPTGSLK